MLFSSSKILCAENRYKKKKKNNRFNGDNRNVKTNGKRRSKQ
jgi:hypothetical protein